MVGCDGAQFFFELVVDVVVVVGGVVVPFLPWLPLLSGAALHIDNYKEKKSLLIKKFKLKLCLVILKTRTDEQVFLHRLYLFLCTQNLTKIFLDNFYEAA